MPPGPLYARGTARLPQEALECIGHSGPHKDRNDACLDEFGITYSQLCALVAVVARHRTGHVITTRATVDAFLREEEGFGAHNTMRDLERRGLLRDCGRLNGAISYEPSARAFVRVDEWTGRAGKRAAAE